MTTISLKIDIRWIRKQRGELAKDTARKLGVSIQTLYAWESGRSYPNEENQKSLLKWLMGSKIRERSPEEAVKVWLENKEKEAIDIVDTDDWSTEPGTDQFLVELKRPEGVSKLEMAKYIGDAVKVECGCRFPEDPIFDFCHLRNTVKVKYGSQK